MYSLILRKEFVAAAELLRKVSGIEKSWPLSVHDLTAAIFYALARKRLERGSFPEREEVIHRLKVKTTKETTSPSLLAAVEADDVQNDFDPLAQSVANLLSEADKFIAQNGNDDLESEEISKGCEVNGKSEGGAKKSVEKAVCEPATAPLVSSMLFYAPLALDFVYRTDPLEIQLLAAQQGWNLLYAVLEHASKSAYDQPGE